MTEPFVLTPEGVKSLLKCGRCGGPAYSHTALSRAATAREGGEPVCSLDVMESRASRVEKIVDEQVHVALQPFRQLFLDWEAKLPDVESDQEWVVQLAECVIDLGNLLVPKPTRGGMVHGPGCDGHPCICSLSVSIMDDVDGDLAEIEEIAAARAMATAPPRGRWLHAHLRTCAVQEWFQSWGVDPPPDCTCEEEQT